MNITPIKYSYFLLVFSSCLLGYALLRNTDKQQGLSSVESNPCFALLTDFGYDFAVGTVKATLLNHLPMCHYC